MAENMNNQKLTRKELYDLVWSTPFNKLCEKFAVSKDRLKKICEKFEIPVPQNGFWMKLQFNKNVEIVPFSEDYSGENEISFNERNEEGEIIISKITALRLLENEINESLGEYLNVPEKLINPHPKIAASKEFFTVTKLDHWHKGYYDLLRKAFYIEATSQCYMRALRIMDTFIEAMEKRGHKTTVGDRSVYVKIQEEQFEIKIRERYKKIQTESDGFGERTSRINNGELAIAVVERYGKDVWQDGKLPLEKQIAKIIAGLEIRAEEEKQRHIRCAIHRKEEAEKKRIREERLERKKKELKDFKDLLRSSKRWHEAENIRKYIAEVEAKATENNNYNEDVKNWILWAQKKADWYDPFIMAADEYLEGVNRDELKIEYW